MKNCSVGPFGNYIVVGKLFVPEFQREYAWKKEEINDFWNDLKEVIDRRRQTHFLGQIVIYTEKNTLERIVGDRVFSVEEENRFIIDGQQRTTTCVILLNVIKKHLVSLRNYRQANEYVVNTLNRYTGYYDAEGDNFTLTLGDTDKEFFKDHVQKNIAFPRDVVVESHKLIKSSFLFFDRVISELLGSLVTDEHKYQMLTHIVNCLVLDFKILEIEADDEDEAYVVFETLNARGKELEASDLLKNYVYRSATGRLQEVKQNWSIMKETLGGEDLTRFIRYFYNSKYGFTRDRELYRNIKDRVRSPLNSVLFTSSLRESSLLYLGLVNPKGEDYFALESIKQALSGLVTLGGSIFYPILISMRDNTRFPEDDILRIVKLLEVLVLRNLIVAGLSANIYEVGASVLACQISENNDLTIDQICNQISGLIIADEEFLSQLRNFSTKSKPLIRYFFRKIVNSVQHEFLLNEDNDHIHIEHIMPVTLNNEWLIDSDSHRDNLWKLGNLTLLGQEYNQAIKNYSFNRKKDFYRISQIELNNDLCEFEVWNIDSIVNRQEVLSNIAVTLWR